MRLFFATLFALSFLTAQGQDTAHRSFSQHPAVYKRYSIMATVSPGFVDGYRSDYSLPAGFSKGNTTGFAPIHAKLEYGVLCHTSIAALFGYDAFVYNYKQNYTGSSGPFTRYRTNKTRIFSAGVAAFYHLDRYIHSRRLDPFIGLGICLNNIRYGSHPLADSSTAVIIDHTVTPYLKAGIRYYITDKFSLWGDVGYDKQSLVDLGISCRFLTKRSK
jgi:hypothetical protein